MSGKNPQTGSDGVARRGFLTSMDAGAIGVAASDHLLAAGGEASEPPVMPAGQPSNQDLAADQRSNPCGAGGAALGLKERKGRCFIVDLLQVIRKERDVVSLLIYNRYSCSSIFFAAIINCPSSPTR
jgi:hypothetical protein